MAHRERYARELVTELYGMTYVQQLRHASGVLAGAWALRSALTYQRETAMTTAMITRKPLRCRLGLHDWDDRENPETLEHYQICLR